MKLFRFSFFASGLVASALLGAIACGSGNNDTGKDPSSDADSLGGASSVDQSDLRALEEELERLRSELDLALSDEERAALEARIRQLEEDLEALTNPSACEDGVCPPSQTAGAAMLPIFEALCDQIFGCCSDTQRIVSLGLGITDGASCAEALIERGLRGEDYRDFFGANLLDVDGLDLPPLEDLARALGAEQVTVDEEAVAICADAIRALDCGGWETNFDGYGFGYGNCEPLVPLAKPCGEEFVLGHVGEGGACRRWGYFNECASGLTCVGNTDHGTCARAGETGAVCFSDDECDEHHFCESETSRCVADGQAGDDCEYDFGQTSVTGGGSKPCAQGLQCSHYTNKCVAHCEEGAACETNADCTEGFVCEPSSAETFPNYARCVPGAKPSEGQACDVDEECASKVCAPGPGTGDVCQAPCAEAEDCADGQYCYDGRYCLSIAEAGQSCFEDEGCASGLCIGGTCYAPVSAGGACPSSEGFVSASRVCPEAQYCNNDSCVDRHALETSCGTSAQCVAGAYCAGEPGTCLSLATEGEDCSSTPCMLGLTCVSYLAGEEMVEICLPPKDRSEGQFCGTETTSMSHTLCESGLCQAGESYATCATGFQEGAACDPTGAVAANSNEARSQDPCASNLYCRVNDWDAETLTGTCEPLLSIGEECDPSYDFGHHQCGVENHCIEAWDTSRCYGGFTDDERRMCPIDTPALIQ